MKKAFQSYFVPFGAPTSQRQAPPWPTDSQPRAESQQTGSSFYGRSVGHSASSPSQSSAAIPPPPPPPSQVRIGHPPTALFPSGANANFRIVDAKNDMMVKWLYEQQLRKQYATGLDQVEGVVLKKSRGDFTCFPPELQVHPTGLFAMVVAMNVRCAMTVNTPAVRSMMVALRTRDIDFVPLPGRLRVQILSCMADLPKCQVHHFAAFIEDLRMLVVWDDEPGHLLRRAEELEKRFMELIWLGNNSSDDSETEEKDIEEGLEGAKHEAVDGAAMEEGLEKEDRPVRLQASLVVSGALALCTSCLGLGARSLALEIQVDGDYTRLVILVQFPIIVFLSLFFFLSIISNLFQMFGPISAVKTNSKYFSGKAPRRLTRTWAGKALPHVTIQMPVYKEGLAAVIRPTVMSIKHAISTYEMQGGTANIFVNDDGMQLLGDEDAQARRDFYDEHNIGWVARPPHDPSGTGPRAAASAGRPFLRRGKFKKASNMNYALHMSNRVEEKLLAVARGTRWRQADEDGAYATALADVLAEDEGRSWAEGNIRVGDYILLIDSDTRVPGDCFLDAVSEMEQSPNVAVIQFSSGVMQVTKSYFENGVTWFTNLIYSAITFAVANGDACPFVGHNAILRWRAIQDAAAYTDADGYEKYWSESHVSEDFDMSLRLQVAGYAMRYAAYTGDGFKEGVSLTVYDELARWEKYAYGCNELLFHPLRFWPVRGPFTKLFRQFIFSSIPFPKKVTICAYIGTYYAIAGAWVTTLVNYFITGWYTGYIDKFYVDSFAIYISIVVVFSGMGNIALAVLRYRLCQKSLIGAFIENLTWVPMFTIFLGGISIHVSQAILSHFFEIEMVWGATAKEAEEVHFGEEVVRILRKFRWTFVFCAASTALIFCGWFVFPLFWEIRAFYSVYPMGITVFSHFALPVLLNPALMMFTW